jgi:hypothetical protein
MRKLNPFQLPQVHTAPQTTSTPSTSDTEPQSNCSLDKHMLAAVEPDRESSTRSVGETMQPCSSNPDLFNIVLSEQQENADMNRPRQYGRRSNPVRISSFAADLSSNGPAVRRKLRDMEESSNYDHSSVSLLITSNKRGGQQAPRSNDYITPRTVFTGHERAYRPSRVHWLHHATLVPFPSHQAPGRVRWLTQLPKLMYDRDSSHQAVATTMTPMPVTTRMNRKFHGRTR